ncbi:hypothetical protein FJY84_04220 [Candidatus Bathyarchaeota archaeon]|nr:hypothetical protein [Candidatus Bathyarchaeota archaeon]
MVKKILQINFKYKPSAEEIHKAFEPAVPIFVNMKELEWKIWLIDPTKKTAGGIYLFKDEKSVNEYLGGPVVASLKKNPALSDLEMKVFDIIPDFTKSTRGPV